MFAVNAVPASAQFTRREVVTQRYDAGIPAAPVRVLSVRNLVGANCQPTNGTLQAGSMTTIDLSQFVAPFSVQWRPRIFTVRTRTPRERTTRRKPDRPTQGGRR
jgi:hypothetical protein